MPAQRRGVREAAGLTADDTDRAAWTVRPDGRRDAGAAAVARALDTVLPGGPPVLYSIYRIPGLCHLADAAYRWVARNRHRLPGIAALDAGEPDPLDDVSRAILEQRLRPGSPLDPA